jgi:16S rRNA (cytosine1402-N4)-methyltransferase
MEKAKNRLAPYGERFQARNIWFDEFWKSYDGPAVDYVLFDLGISVFHYEESGRGFSFKRQEKLDMRLDVNGDLDAAQVQMTGLAIQTVFYFVTASVAVYLENLHLKRQNA